jgi:hypothetical protein
MRRWSALGLLALAACATFGSGAPLAPEEKASFNLSAWSQTARFLAFRAGERALVIATGNGRSPLTLYIFDPDGNCVAKDDVVEMRGSSDDVAVEWFPPETARYTVELHNVGFRANRVEMITR